MKKFLIILIILIIIAVLFNKESKNHISEATVIEKIFSTTILKLDDSDKTMELNSNIFNIGDKVKAHYNIDNYILTKVEGLDYDATKLVNSIINDKILVSYKNKINITAIYLNEEYNLNFFLLPKKLNNQEYDTLLPSEFIDAYDCSLEGYDCISVKEVPDFYKNSKIIIKIDNEYKLNSIQNVDLNEAVEFSNDNEILFTSIGHGIYSIELEMNDNIIDLLIIL